ncbi:redoxin domain-containing protein [Lujinxingia vulgaris]|uniref:Redoxin domain-containing protein n=1 Tax=Lujinxingia vulgaris TaxID=2600176 RepID=A0A5C6XB67_9DELT|nr:redoxin domain-containing protein [Lujinxingia vulgaris]TXD39147.1 redoxin domain-containing protein [Lujinxingia vulgaris]
MRLSPCTHGIRPPEFPELPWINVDAPLRLEDLLGQVVMLGFWSSSCIRCQEGLPAMYRALQRFEGRPLQIIAVHSPRFVGEHDLDYVRSAVGRVGVPFAVAADNEHRISRTFNVREFPTIALIDPRGYVCRVLRGVPEPLQLIDALEGLLGLTDAARRPHPTPMPAQPSPDALRFPAGLSAQDDRLAIADTGHHRIILTDTSGEVIHCFGGPEPGFEDGPPDRARFFSPHGLALVENQILVADTTNHAIRVIDPLSGHTDTLAIMPPDAQGRIHAPWSLIRQGPWIFVACAGTHTILRMSADGTSIEHYAGCGDEDRIDGHRTTAAFAQPTDLASNNERLHVIDSTSSALRCLNLRSNRVHTLIGKSLFEHGQVDGPSRTALMQHPRGIALHKGNIYVADSLNCALRCFDPEREELDTLDAPKLDFPTALASADGVLWVCDTHAPAIWKHDTDSGTWERLELTWPDNGDTAP